MGAETKIQWCDYTFNPWEGCTKVSPGCAHCYAEVRNARFGGGTAPNWGKGAPRRRTSAHNWNEPRRWDRAAALHEAACLAAVTALPARPRVFCASLADWLDDEVPLEWLADLLALIQATPHLDWLLLTKRPENWAARLNAVVAWAMERDIHIAPVIQWLKGKARDNVWIGTTVEDQQRAEERIPTLLAIPARVRFLSCEPMLGKIDLAYACFNGADSFGTMPGIDWVIIGGESGAGAREFHTEHAWDLLYQCRKADVAPFVKQLGANPVTSNANAMEWPASTVFLDYGSEAAAGARVALQDKKGGDLAEWPVELRVREFPANSRDQKRPATLDTK